MSKRLDYLDALKGIAIIFIIIFHRPWNMIIDDYAKAVSVPIFFVISGFFLHKENLLITINKSFKRLVLPILYTSLSIVLILSIVIYKFYFLSPSNLTPLFYEFLFTQTNFIGSWFLYTLFWSRLFSQILYRIIGNFSIFFSIVLFLIISQIDVFQKDFLWILHGIQALPFVYFGFWLRELGCVERAYSYADISIFACLCLLTYMLKIDIFICDYPLGVLTVLLACIFCFSWMTVTYHISQMKLVNNSIFYRILLFYGRNSLLVLCVHAIECSFCIPQRHPEIALFYAIVIIPVIGVFAFLIGKIKNMLLSFAK